MSYCRWSSNNWKRHVYVYQDVDGGWTTHLVAFKIIGDIPEELLHTEQSVADGSWLASRRAAMEFLEHAERAPIGLPRDGETFNDSTLGKCAERLLYLRSLGHCVPQYAVDELQAGQRVMDGGP